jgi:hypothetical protein
MAKKIDEVQEFLAPIRSRTAGHNRPHAIRQAPEGSTVRIGGEREGSRVGITIEPGSAGASNIEHAIARRARRTRRACR